MPPTDQERFQRLSIGQFAQIALLSPKALRIYAERGLLEPEWIDPASGYRYYTVSQAPTGRMISMLRAAGLSLDEISRIIGSGSPMRSLELLDAAVRSRRQQAHASELLLRRAQDHYERAACDREADLIEREMSRRAEAFARADGLTGEARSADHQIVSEIVMTDDFVLSHLARVTVGELDDDMERTLQRLEGMADEQGLTRTSSPFGIFHGPVNDESGGPLEIALPVSGLGESRGDIRSCRVQGGHMACTTAVGSATDYPAILAAYDRTCDWIERQALQLTGPPREYWRTLPWEGQAHMVIAWPFARVSNALIQPEML